MPNASRLSGWLVLALLLGAATLASAADPAKAPAAPAMTPEQQKMMEEMTKSMQPGEHHKRLDVYAGSWKTHVKLWLDPHAPPMENDGTMEAKWVMGGRYMVSHHMGTFMGQPFEGQSIDGYDNMSKKYVSTWIDNQGTGFLNLSGDCDPGCKVLTESGDMIDPATHAKMTYKSVTTFVDANSFKYEAFAVDAASHSTKVMEMVCTRTH